MPGRCLLRSPEWSLYSLVKRGRTVSKRRSSLRYSHLPYPHGVSQGTAAAEEQYCEIPRCTPLSSVLCAFGQSQPDQIRRRSGEQNRLGTLCPEYYGHVLRDSLSNSRPPPHLRFSCPCSQALLPGCLRSWV